jgi:hypothetical protein
VKLYELTNEMAALNSLDAEGDDDMRQAIIDTLDGMSCELQEKATSIAYFVRNIDSDIDALSAEIARLNTRKKVLQYRADSVTDYLRSNMVRAGITKIECPLFVISCRAGREIAFIDDESAIPDEFMTVKTDITPNKNAICKAMKDGLEVPGAHLELSKSSLIIK